MKKMLIALLTAASLHATAQTEGNKTLLPEKTADTLQLINPKLAPLSPDSLLPSVMVRKPADGLKLNQNFTNYDRTSNPNTKCLTPCEPEEVSETQNSDPVCPWL
jgi:hypothetical protein